MTQAQDKALFNHNKRLIKARLPEQTPCPYCNCIMIKDTKHPYALVSIDHVVPYSKGGSDELSNLKACCGNCNTRKGNKNEVTGFWLTTPLLLSPEEFIKLNDYISITHRLKVLREVAGYLKSDDFESAMEVTKKNENKSRLGFFSKLVIHLKETSRRYKDNKKELVYNCLALTVIRIKSEDSKLSQLKEDLAHLDFSIKAFK